MDSKLLSEGPLSEKLIISKNMMVVCKDHLEFFQSKERIGVEAAAAVETDISALLSEKTYDDLSNLQRRVQEKLASGEPLDTDYWEGLLRKILVWKAKVGINLFPAVSCIDVNFRLS